MLITRHEGETHFYAWVDAASQNRIDGGSTHVSPVSWHSTRIDRACRSPGASETAAAVNGEDMLYYVRYQWSEMLYGKPDLRQPDATGHSGSSTRMCDHRLEERLRQASNRDVLHQWSGEESQHRLKEAQEATGVILRWVHSEAQLANALTKAQNHKELELYYSTRHQWHIVEEPEMKSVRKRKNEGLDPLQQVSG